MALEPDAVRDTLGVLLKYQEDVEKMLDGEAVHLLDQMRTAATLR